ncbi:DUF4178 domain-containing protein [Sphingomonas sp.]|uniref:DUF4178 domain-containing protein n=1 Tax=Sphingomonas sp. TaxID=28214 RepID=UPI001DD4BB52|nr:DUF4178 domain-containing protein [Sphingomonas sp.]MBX9797285.1 DUF4178 domain-containing protein [Sphingomonas sp.]
MALHLPCPNCGADVVFRSAALPMRVCDHCQTMLVRSDEGIAQAGKAAALPFDVSPIQIGTAGRFGGQAFDVIGRIRWGWTDGSWNEWLLLFAGGGTAWLGEAMGQYMLTVERPLSDLKMRGLAAVLAGNDAVIGDQAEVEGETLFVADARAVDCLAAEGELPFRAPAGWRIYSIDLRAPSGNCASLQRDGGEATFYVGRYVTLAELAPRNLRVIEGWARPDYAA